MSARPSVIPLPPLPFGSCIFALLWMAAVSAAMFAASDARAQDTPPGRTLKVGVESDFQGFDPVRTGLMGISTLIAAIALYDTLIALDRDGRIVPKLALSFTPAAEGKRWTAKLRPGVLFHDGTPFNAQAVVSHFERIRAPESRCPCRELFAPLTKVEALDAETVVFTLAHPWAALPAMIGEPSVVSLIGSPSAIARLGEDYNRRPVGTGPFVFKEWRSGDQLVVERNPRYWQAGLPHLDSVVFRVLPDQQTRLAAVQAGDVDVIWTLEGHQVLQAQQDERLTIERHAGAGARIFVLNTQTEQLQDVRVRQALAHALNMDLFAQSAHQGLVNRALDPFGPSSTIACDNLAYPAYDPERAQALLAEYRRPVKLELLHTATPRGRQTGQVLQHFWRAVGIEVQLVAVDEVQLLQRVLRGQYQIGAWRIRDSHDPDPDLFSLFYSESKFNVTGYRQPEVDQLLMTGRTAVDLQARREAYCKLARRLSEDMPVLLGMQNTYFAVARQGVAGIPALLGGVLDVRAARLVP